MRWYRMDPLHMPEYHPHHPDHTSIDPIWSCAGLQAVRVNPFGQSINGQGDRHAYDTQVARVALLPVGARNPEYPLPLMHSHMRTPRLPMLGVSSDIAS